MKTRPDECELVMGKKINEGIEVLRRVLMRLRWDDQGGFPDYRMGQWDFVTAGLPQVTPEELNVLMKLAGIVPDEIVPIGGCATCKFSLAGRSRGWTAPCVSCKMPMMSNYKPAPKCAARS